MIFGVSIWWMIAAGYFLISSIALADNVITLKKYPDVYKARYASRNKPCPTKFDLVRVFVCSLLGSLAFGAVFSYIFY